VALLVGVNQYDKRGFAARPLQFAERDVEELAGVLELHGFQVRQLTGSAKGADRATRANVLAALDALLKDVDSRDTVLVAFAGHGEQIPLKDAQGRPLKDDLGRTREDAYFCPVDAVQGDAGTLISLTGLMQKLDRRGGIS
jgi:uncharacterized caspase-like protein